MNKIRFSVIIPAYNVENYVEDCINSVLNQTFTNYELIVVEDSSTDSTNKKIKAFGNKIKLIEIKQNCAAGGARNSGLNIAKGEYIIFLDADDRLYDNDVLEKLDKLIGEQNVDVIYQGFKFIGDRDELVIPSEETCTRKYKASEDVYPNVWSKTWNREFIEKNELRFVEKRFYEDVLFNFKAIMAANSYLIAKFPVHKYLSGRPDSMTTTLTFKNIDDTIYNIKELKAIKDRDDSEEVNILLKREVKMCKKRMEKVVWEIK